VLKHLSVDYSIHIKKCKEKREKNYKKPCKNIKENKEYGKGMEGSWNKENIKYRKIIINCYRCRMH
jgi:hypothetical protein